MTSRSSRLRTTCPVHPRVELREVCGEPGCGSCYEADLIAEPVPDRQFEYPALETVWQESSHKYVTRKSTPR